MTPPQHERSVCPVACTLDLLGDRWTLLVIRDLFCGKRHFKEFRASPEGIATNILSNRLQRLVEHGVAEQYPSSEHAGRLAYRLTAKGKALRGVLRSVSEWGLEWLPGTEARLQVAEDAGDS